ncbi:YncE family protein [Humitalea sp. 24SJ18S-53]|uniref:YncE family protein n=1 Tax=Humitalea sp. 24SJ18S-53 TaxID=3422307 RepID=UPI003D67A241
MRRLAALMLLFLGLATPPARADVLYVLNSGDAEIMVLDATTRQEIRRIGVLREAHHLVWAPDRSVLLIGDSGGNEMLFVQPATGEVLRRERISNPYHMEFSPDGKHLVVTSLRRNQVDIYAWNGTDLALRARLRMPDKPSHLAFRPDSKIVYVTLQGSRAMAAISLETQLPLWQMEVGREPAGVIWHNDRLLVGIMGSDHVAVVNPETRAVERTIFTGRGAHALFVGPNQGPVYVTSRVDSRITALDPTTLQMTQSWVVPGGPDCLTFDPEGRIWATLRWSGRVGVLDPETGAQESFRIGRSPHGILYVPVRPTAAAPRTASATR